MTSTTKRNTARGLFAGLALALSSPCILGGPLPLAPDSLSRFPTPLPTDGALAALPTAESSAIAMSETADLGRMAAGAERCGLDAPGLIATQTGIQLAANILSMQRPSQAVDAMALFQDSLTGFRLEYDASSEEAKSRMCAFAWLGWRSARHASSMATALPDLSETVELAQSAGTIHGWLRVCQLRGALASDPSSEIVHQAGDELAFAALSSARLDDLSAAQAAWRSGYASAASSSEFKIADCAVVEQSLPVLAASFAKKPGFDQAIRRAKATMKRAMGPQS